MIPNRLSNIACPILFLIGITHGYRALGDEINMSPSTFRQLSLDDQKAVVIAAIARRLEHSKNLRLEVDSRAWSHRSPDRPTWDMPNDPSLLANPNRYRVCFLNDSYLMEVSSFSRFNDPSLRAPLYHVSNSWNREQGVNRSRVRQSQAPDRTDYQIRTDQDEIIVSGNRYWYWLDGERSTHGEHFLRYLYDNRDQISIDPAVDGEKTVTIRVPWDPWWKREYCGETRLVLDPKKGFLPIETHGRWEKGDQWRIQEYYVLESKLVGDVWMPTKLQEIRRASLLRPDEATVYNMTVLSIEQGVTPEDLVLDFPPGAEVLDAIKGVFYVVGPNGEPTHERALVGMDAVMAAEAAERRANPMWFWLLLVNGGAILALLIFASLRRYFRKQNPVV